MSSKDTSVPLVPETAKQGADPDDPSTWSWVAASVWTERMLAALGNGVEGGKWYALMDKVTASRTLWAAWQRVARNRGAAGVDRMSIKRFEANAACYLEELGAALRDGSYRPAAVRRMHIPKGNTTRPLGIPTVKDRVVQTALKLVLEPIFEKDFLPVSYGFRPKRGCKDALREVDRWLKAGYTWVVDADVASYFDTIPHARVMACVKEKVSDGQVLQLVQCFLEQDVLDGMNRWTPVAGTPQGAVISPLLSNLYLHSLDVRMITAGRIIVRYADDFVILCQSQEEAEAALAEVEAWTAQNGLALHPDKTHVGNCTEAGHGFDFLGYRFDGGHRYVRRKSLQALKDKIRQLTGRTRSGSMKDIIAELNPILKGWFGYFKHARGSNFRTIDGFVRRRLRAVLRKREKRPGFGRTASDHRRWPNAFFAVHELFTFHEAHALASQSR
jgi:RNA-directed DNA polymerase